jgi:CRP/FNR family cyclic AMP-dependent transcriptional regulator
VVDKKTLSRMELFVGLPDRALAAIAGLAELRRFAAGEIIFSPERSAQWAFLLLSGTVRLTVHASALPEPVTLTSLETPGHAFGFSSVLGQGAHNSAAEAVTAVEAVAVDCPRLLAYLEKDPEVGFVVMTRVARAVSRRLATLRRLLLETIIDYERPVSTIPEN